jgi:hypothetical protein
MPKALPLTKGKVELAITASLGAVRRPLPVRSKGTNTTKFDQTLTNGKNSFETDEIKYPPNMKGFLFPNLSDQYPEKTFNMPERLSPRPPIKPTARPAPPKDTINKGITAKIISLEISFMKLVNPKRRTLGPIP